MKYFFISIVGFISFYIVAGGMSFPSYAAALPPEDEGNKPNTENEATIDPKDNKSATKSSDVFLEETFIGRAVINGDKDAYKATLAELTAGFSVKLIDVLTKKTSDGETLLELMITAKAHQDFFNTEMMALLTGIAITDMANVSTYINSLLRKAQQSKNNQAIRSLTTFKTLYEKTERDSISSKESMLQLLKNSKHNIKFTSAGIYVVTGVLAIALGERFVSSATSLAELIALIPPNISANANQLVGWGGIAVGTALGVKGLSRCKKAFRQSRQLKQQKQQLNTRRNNLENL